MSTLYRAQILLEPEQHEALKRLAREDGRSVSDVVRELLRQYLAEVEQEAQTQRELQPVEDLAHKRKRLCEERGMYRGQLIDEIRVERERDREWLWQGDE